MQHSRFEGSEVTMAGKKKKEPTFSQTRFENWAKPEYQDQLGFVRSYEPPPQIVVEGNCVTFYCQPSVHHRSPGRNPSSGTQS
jgi:hypothetical protein